MNELFKRIDNHGYQVRLLDGEYTLMTDYWQMDNFHYSLVVEAVRQSIEGIDQDAWYFSSIEDD